MAATADAGRPAEIEPVTFGARSFQAFPTIALAVLIGVGVASLVYHGVPLADPPGIVGVPLLTGYSERSEQASFLAFLLATLVSARGLSRLRQPSAKLRGALGGAGLALLVSAPGSSRHIALMGCSGVALALFSLTIVIDLQAPARRLWVAVVGVLASAAYRHEDAFVLREVGAAIVPALVGLLLLAYFLARRLTISFPNLAGSALSLILVGSGAWQDLTSALVGASALTLGWAAQAYPGSSCALFATGLGLWATLASPPLGYPLGRGAIATIAGAGLASMLSQMPWRSIWRRAEAIQTGLPKTVFPAFQAARRPGFRCALLVLLSASLWLIRLPTRSAEQLANPNLDPFHDGQLLSAVWEWESGRPLFTDVVPLRLHEFWMTWLTFRWLPQTAASFHFGVEISAALGAVGVFLLTVVVTGRVWWSFATAVVGALMLEPDPRVGVQLILVAGCWAARRLSLPSRGAIYGLAVVAATFGGFDTLTVVTATIVGFGVVGRCDFPSLRRRFAFALAVVGIVFVGVLIGLVPLLGWQGVMDYGELYVGYARFYPAFYGMPLPWGDAESRPWLVATLIGLGMTGSIAVWPTTSLRWRRLASGLTILLATVAQRGMGRSDPTHLVAVFQPLVVLGSFGLFRLVRTSGRGLEFAISAGALLVLLMVRPWPGASMQAFLGYVERVAKQRDDWPPAPAIVLERVATDAYFWDFEFGLTNFLARRHNPTRHALPYCIGWPAEQKRAIADLRRRPPSLIAWKFVSGSNGIANTVRQYLLADEVMRTYTPIESGAFLAPKPANWRPLAETPTHTAGPLKLGVAPMTWSANADAWFPGRKPTQELVGQTDLWRPTTPAGFDPDRDKLVLLQLSNIGAEPRSADRSGLIVVLGVDSRGVETPILEFAAPARGASFSALAPLFCSPTWVWTKPFQSLRVQLPEDSRWTVDRITLLHVDFEHE